MAVLFLFFVFLTKEEMMLTFTVASGNTSKQNLVKFQNCPCLRHRLIGNKYD